MSIPLAELVRMPLPAVGGPSRFSFVASGAGARSLVWLAPASEGSMVQALWRIDDTEEAPRPWVEAPGATAEAGLSHEEQMRRERLRERALGITTYHACAGTVLVPCDGELWIRRPDDATLSRLIDAPALDARLSPDGTQVAFVRDAEIYVAETATGRSRQVTHGARGTGRTHGLAEYIAQEEMKRFAGFWWSPDGRAIAFVRVDETHLPVWRIPHEGKAKPTWEDHRYPFAGAANAAVSLHVVWLADGTVVDVDLSCADPWEYLARVGWLGADTLIAAVQDRRQQRLDLVRVDPATGVGSVFRSEQQAPWINLHEIFRPLDGNPGSFLWASERTGFLHLVVVGVDGSERALTQGEWVVDELCGVDERRGLVWFLGAADGPLERHLYEGRLDGGPIRRLTLERGFHTVTVDPRSDRFVDTWSTAQTPSRTVVRELSTGASVRTLHEARDPRIAALGLQAPEPWTVVGPDGTTLHGALYRPDGPGPFPLVVFVYGGPHAQRVADRWDVTVDLRAQHLRGEGVAVFKLDNRGSARRGLAFEAGLHLETGRVELEDQVAGVEQLVAAGIVDPARVGIVGWSYGGYLSALALLKASETFQVAVAGAPVTHWDAYDTHYTERYMGLPDENPEGYSRSSVLAHVEALRGHLMVVHGMIDENVHFRHTGRLVNALVAARKDFEVQLFPDERHTPRKPDDRLYMERRIVGFLLRHLRP